MASIYKRTSDKGQKRPCWYLAYTDHQGKRRVVRGFTDKGQTERLAAHLEEETRMVRHGLKPAPSETTGERIDSLLQRFAQYLADRDVSDKQVGEITSRTKRIAEACRFDKPQQIAAMEVERYLADCRAGGMSKQTSNHYVKALRQFCRWLVRNKVLVEDPTTNIRLLNVKTDRRHDRRPLTVEELTRLIAAAERGRREVGVSGPDRAAMYLIAAHTGFRRSEIGSITLSSFCLKSDPPTLTVKAAHSKRRQLDTQVLSAEVAEYLGAWLQTKKAKDGDLLLPISELSGGTDRCTAKMMRRDLKVARAAWVNEAVTDEDRAARSSSDFLVYKDKNGRFADFHATRHTFITNLGRAGVPPKTAQQLARHSDIRLTMNVYSHTDLSEKAAAVQKLPSVLGSNSNGGVSSPVETVKADAQERCRSAPGSQDGKVGHTVSQSVTGGKADEEPTDSSEVLTDSGLDATCQRASPKETSTPHWARTSNLRFRRPMRSSAKWPCFSVVSP